MRMFVRLGVWSMVVLVVVLTVLNLTIAKLPSMPQPDGTYTSLRGKDIHYVEQPGEGPAVVMIHGLPGTHEDFDPVLPHLQGRHVITFDRPGFGWSKGGWLPYQEQIDLVHEMLTQRKVSPAIVVGHSFGGTVALGQARRYPRDLIKMILVAPGAGGTRSQPMDEFNAHYVRFTQLPLVRTLVDVAPGDVIKRVVATSGAKRAFEPAPVDPAYQRRLLSVTMTPGNMAAFASDQLEFDDTSRWLDDNVPQIRVPSLIIAAIDDKLINIDHPRRLADTLPGTRLLTVDGNHMIPYTHPDVIAAQILG
ncbi:alpha/beta fold hydrolase [Mycobacterium sp. NPDC048908]|uniref:alpha/beta fold hydrolase n=1 Tax=Mycobacterium sp. NPDC048908 TaxID=3364292 RepID=UPI00371D2F36